MKKLITLIAVSFLLQSCGSGIIPLKSDYSKVNNTFYTDMGKDKVWDNIVKLFSTNGLGISLIDKSSGLIISNKTDFLKDYTNEDEQGVIKNKNAFIVVERFEGGMGNLPPSNLYGTWNIRLFEENGKTGVNINLTNIEAFHTIDGTKYTNAGKIAYNAKSIGNFEKMVMDKITF